MTTTAITTNSIGSGPRHTFTADGDALFITQGVTVGATSGSALDGLSFNNLQVFVSGALLSDQALGFNGTDSQMIVAEGASLSSLSSSATNLMIRFSGDGGSLSNYGTMSAPGRVAYVGDNDTSFYNYGVVAAASPALLGLFGAANARMVNGSSISANDFEDAGQSLRYNNGVLIEGQNNLVSNLAGGTIAAVSAEGAGARLYGSAGGSVVKNYGHIESLQDYGVHLGDVSVGQGLIRIFNWGTIAGGDGAYIGSANADRLVNRGSLDGDVAMGAGDDTLDNRNGTIEGDVAMGEGDDIYNGIGGTASGTVLGQGGNDRFFGNALLAEVFDGGDGVDTLDFSLMEAVVVALDNSLVASGSALGDTYSSFENVFGSNSGDDLIVGSNAANTLFGNGGADVIDGLRGNDVLRGGIGIDTLTGGHGHDSFRFYRTNEFGDKINDFSSAAVGNNDRFQFSTAIGGGLSVGAIDPGEFQVRADNQAQDADDRFIFRTTDRTLWFDEDGNGAAAALMVADLQAGATVTAGDIFIF